MNRANDKPPRFLQDSLPQILAALVVAIVVTAGNSYVMLSNLDQRVADHIERAEARFAALDARLAQLEGADFHTLGLHLDAFRQHIGARLDAIGQRLDRLEGIEILPQSERRLEKLELQRQVDNSRLADLEAFRTRGRRFTAEQGDALAARLERLEQQSNQWRLRLVRFEALLQNRPQRFAPADPAAGADY